MSVSEVVPEPTAFSPRSQAILLLARDTAASNLTQGKPPSEITLDMISKIVLQSINIGLLAPVPARYDMRQALLFHRLACYQALAVAALPNLLAPDTGLDKINDAERCKRKCETALKAYVVEAFDAGLADKLMVKLQEAAPKVVFVSTDR